MTEQEALDLVVAWKETLEDAIRSPDRITPYGGRASVRESVQALEIVLEMAKREKVGRCAP